MSHSPIVVGLTLCQDVVVEPSGNVTLVRGFSGTPILGFPGSPDPFCVYALLLDGRGQVPFSLTVERYGEHIETIRMYRGQISFRDRHTAVQFVVRMSNLVLPSPGGYLFTLYLSGQWAAQRWLRVYEKEDQP